MHWIFPALEHQQNLPETVLAIIIRSNPTDLLEFAFSMSADRHTAECLAASYAHVFLVTAIFNCTVGSSDATRFRIAEAVAVQPAAVAGSSCGSQEDDG
jgi:hypothetical protein